MGKTTGIEWTDHTFNLVIGCTKVSPGCANCYAETLAAKRGWSSWGPNGERKIMAESYWQQPYQWNRKAEKEGRKHKVFCSSLADVFEDHPVVNEQRERLWDVIEKTPHLIWQLLTKRPENIMKFVADRFPDRIPRNIWFGVTAENQDMLMSRVPILQSFAMGWFPAKLFISAEPLLGPLDLECFLKPWIEEEKFIPGLDWVIVGGESGHNARPCYTQWIHDIVEQCQAEYVPVFVKQLGQNIQVLPSEAHLLHTDRKGKKPFDKRGTINKFPESLRVREFPE